MSAEEEGDQKVIFAHYSSKQLVSNIMWHAIPCL